MTSNQLLSNRYQIIQKLGHGGFGETFLAEDTQMPSRRRCVVKKLRPTADNPALTKLIQERFQREAATLENLSSGNRQIPQLYAYFYSETDQQFYLVQEWIDGQTLTALLQAQGIQSETAVRKLLTDILPVFSYIHGRSIVHRDIKPDNIILRHSDHLPVLIDFGAVREAMGTVMNSQGQATQSIVIGTPGYMPSEQSIGRPVYNSDFYSLGLTAIYLLTGKQPTDFPSDPHSAEILWRSSAPQVSSALAQVLDKAISYHHRDRYQSAQELLADLSGSPAAAGIPTVPQQAVASNSNVATYAVSPGAPGTATEQLTATSPQGDKNKLVIGGAIAATIVGGTVATALFLSNSGNKNGNVANNPTPVVASATATPTPVGTASMASASSSPSASTSPTPKSSAQPSATTSSKPSAASSMPKPSDMPKLAMVVAPPSNVRKSPDGDPICSITERKLISTYGTNGIWYFTDACGEMGVIHSSQIKFSTDTSPTSNSNASSPSPSVDNNKIPPTTAVTAYYASLTDRDYQKAWNQLPKELQDDTKVHPEGYISFENWWKSIDRIELRDVKIVNQTANSAEAIASTVYRMKNGSSQQFSIRYSLVWNASTQSWDIAKVRA
jgi:serine/threonine protein kinase, bacterial